MPAFEFNDITLSVTLGSRLGAAQPLINHGVTKLC